MITIEAKSLRRMLQQVTPHMPNPEDDLPVVSSIRLETRDGWLYAAATDRYTIAAARREIASAETRIGHIPGHLVPALTAWLDGVAQLGESVDLTLPMVKGSADVILTTSGHGKFTAQYETEDYERFPDWRKILHAALKAEPGPVPLTGFTTQFLARWQHAAEKLATWQEAPGKPLVLLDELGYFAGLHMPVGYHRDGMTRQGLAADWIAATARTAIVDGQTYDLDTTWADRHGDPWTYSGKDCPNGMPLMVLDGIEDDPHPLDRLITQYGPLTPAA